MDSLEYHALSQQNKQTKKALFVGVDRLSAPILSIFMIIGIGHFQKTIYR